MKSSAVKTLIDTDFLDLVDDDEIHCTRREGMHRCTLTIARLYDLGDEEGEKLAEMGKTYYDPELEAHVHVETKPMGSFNNVVIKGSVKDAKFEAYPGGFVLESGYEISSSFGTDIDIFSKGNGISCKVERNKVSGMAETPSGGWSEPWDYEERNLVCNL